MSELESRKNIIESLSDNVFVEAGAGAGKTTLIVNRIVNQLKAGVLPREIVVITFTNAAAEELRGRITLQVRKACDDMTLTEEELTNLKEAVLYLDLMNISTIHSFCFKLLQERTFDAKLPMDAVLMDEADSDKQHRRFFSSFVKKFETSDWNALSVCGDSRFTTASIIRGFFDRICELPDETDIKYDSSVLNTNVVSVADALVQEFEGILCQAMDSALKNKKGKIDSIDKVPDANLRSTGKNIKKMMLMKEKPYKKILESIQEEFTKKTTKYLNVKKADLAQGGDLNALDKQCRDWSDITRFDDIKNTIMQLENYKYTICLHYAIKAREEYRKSRSNRNISNDDLLQKTCRLIRDRKEARDYFAKKIKCIYVDEFQDTDHIQEEFIWRLAAREDNPEKLRDGALFLVGDPKQSIYRFRGAEPEVYFKAKAKMENLDNAKVYHLDFNFRSNAKIIEWVNDYFRGLPICSGGGCYRNMINCKGLHSDASGKLCAGVYYYSEPVEKSTNKPEDAVKLKELIYKLVNNKYLICDYDEDDQPYMREIRYSDFLVLCYSKTDMDFYMRVMEDCGIPVHINGEIELKDNPVLAGFARLFDYLTRPYDRLKKAGARECLQKNGIDAEAVLEMLAEEVKGMSAAGVAKYLLYYPEYLLPQNKDISAATVLSVQTKLEQMVESVLSESGNDDNIIAEQFWDYIDSGIERELQLDVTRDMVRFMNIHKAKGLEGNIVILTKRDERMDFRESAFCDGNEYYPAYATGFGKVVWSAYRYNKDIRSKAEKEDYEEKIRLQYVAATRAKQALIVMDSMSELPMFSNFDINTADGSVEKLIDDGKNVTVISGNAAAYEDKNVKFTPVACTSGKLQNEAICKDISPSDFEKKSETRRKAKEEFLKDKKISSKRPKGNIFGTVMHRGLELLVERWRDDFAKGPSQLVDIMDISVKQAVRESAKDIEAGDIELYKEYLKQVLQSFAGWAYETKLFIEAEEVYTEMPFSFYEKNMQFEENDLPVWMNGTADLMVKDKSGRYIVMDYKSDTDTYLTEEEFECSLNERYSGQLNMYRYAVCRFFGAEKENVSLQILSFKGDDNLQLRCTKLTI